METILVDDCRKRGHKIFETFNGIAWCRRCHERTDAGFAAHSKHLLETVRNTSVDSLSDKVYHDMSLHINGGEMAEDKLYPPTLAIFMGGTSIAQKRRAAYEKAAQNADSHSVSEWARETLDVAAAFKDKK